MRPNYAKLDLGATLNDNPLAGDCHNYGSMSGCDEGCPVLLRGECEIPYDAVENVAVEDRDEILSLYAKEPTHD